MSGQEQITMDAVLCFQRSAKLGPGFGVWVVRASSSFELGRNKSSRSRDRHTSEQHSDQILREPQDGISETREPFPGLPVPEKYEEGQENSFRVFLQAFGMSEGF